jgi:WD40 repeat protein
MNDEGVSFEVICEEWLTLPRVAGQVFFGSDAHNRLLQKLTAPDMRWWFRACHAWIHGSNSPDNPQIAELIASLGPALRRTAHIHVELAMLTRDLWISHAPAENAPAEKELAEFAARHNMPLPLVRDLVDELRTPTNDLASMRGMLCGKLRLPESEQIIPLLFVHTGKVTGVVSDLVVEYLEKRPETEQGKEVSSYKSTLYSAPGLIFAKCNNEFEVAAKTAFSCARDLVRSVANAWDIRWRLRMRKGWPMELTGPSAGGAFTLGIAKLLADHSPPGSEGENADVVEMLRGLNLSGVSVTAAIDEKGIFLPIGGAGCKLSAAALRDSFPHIHTVVVAEEQDIEIYGLEEGAKKQAILRDPGSDFHVIRAANLRAAIRLLSTHLATRWETDCSLPARNPDFVGRKDLTEKVRRFIDDDSRKSGYLVLVGGMGKGKSTFLAEFIHCERSRRDGEALICHIIDYQRPETRKIGNIAKCLYEQLRRKHVFREPDGWKEWREERKLDELLRYLSETQLQKSARKEVLYIDAADQAETSKKEPLLPGALRRLPPGVLCVITSRTDLEWIKSWESVKVWEMEQYTDDRKDVGLYLERAGKRVSPPLSKDLIDSVMKQPAPPVFFTVVGRMRQLADMTEDEAEKERLRNDPGLWVIAPEELAATESVRRVRRAGDIGIGEVEFWKTLGLVAIAKEPPWERLLRRLGVWEEGRTEWILQLAANFFERRPKLRNPEAPYRFEHPGYYREIMRHLDTEDMEECHGKIAKGCEDWSNHRGSVRQYALRHRLEHLAGAGCWEQFAEAFAEAEFIVERGRSERGFAGIYADVREALKSDHLPGEWRDDLTAWERFLRFRIEPLKHFPLAYGQEVANEFLREAHGPFGLELRRLRHLLTGGRDPLLRKVSGPAALGAEGHSDDVTCISFSPDGRKVASGSRDHMVKVWDASSGELLADCGGHRKEVTSVSFSPDGGKVASGSYDRTVKVWDAATGELLANCRGHKGTVTSVSFSPDGRKVASGSWDHTVKLWDASSGQLLADCAGHEDRVYSVSFSPDGRKVTSGSDDKTVKVWDASTGELLADCAGHTGEVTSVSFSPDGRKVASGSYDRTVKVWDASSGELLANCRGHEDSVVSVSFSPNGRKVASGSNDQMVKVWDASSGVLLVDCAGHTKQVRPVSFSPDGRMLASGSWDHTVKVWDASSGKLLADCAGHTTDVTSVSFSPDGRMVASGSYDSTVKVWDASSGRLLADCDTNPAESVCFSPEGHKVASASCDDRTVKVWDASSGELLASCRGHKRTVTSVSFSLNGRKVVSGSKDQTVKVWDASSGELLADCAGHEDDVTSVSFSPDGRKVASGSEDHTVKVWDASSGELLADCAGHKEQVTSVSFSPDGRKVASGSEDHTVKVWDASRGKLLANCAGHRSRVSSVSFSPDGRKVASGNRDHTVKVWDASSGELLANCRGHKKDVTSVSFSPDARKVASGSIDNTAKVWDASSGKLLADCAGHKEQVTSVSFSPDGRKVASGSWDHTVKVWDASSGELLTDFAGHKCYSVSFSPDGRKVASVSYDSAVKVWDASSGELLADCAGHQSKVESLCFSPDGRKVASGSRDHTVKVWDASSGELLADCAGHKSFVTSVSFSPDGRKVASGSWDHTVKVWDASSGELLTDCAGHKSFVTSVSFSPDGRKVASGSEDHTVKVWDASSGELLADCAGHQGIVLSVCFFADGCLVASGGQDRTVKIWDAGTGQCLTILFFSSPPLCPPFTYRQSTRLAVCDSAMRIYTYDVIEATPLDSDRQRICSAHSPVACHPRPGSMPR